MKTTPRYDSLAPVSVGPFNPALQTRNKWRRSRGLRHDPVLPELFDVEEHVSPQAVAAIHRAFTQSKTSHADWRSYKREGRFDPRRAAGATRGDVDVFKRKTGRSTTHVKCAVLIDASGSMRFDDSARIPNPLDPTNPMRVGVTRQIAAAVFGATIARALGRVPTVSLEIFQHSAGVDSNMTIKYRWTRGTPIRVFNEASHQSLSGGGNADGHALFAITERMLRDLKRDERGVIMVVSDGLPSVYSKDGEAQVVVDASAGALMGEIKAREAKARMALVDAVHYARSRGIEVVAVAVDGSDQSAFYGDGVVPFTGNWSALGTGLGKVIGKALARR